MNSTPVRTLGPQLVIGPFSWPMQDMNQSIVQTLPVLFGDVQRYCHCSDLQNEDGTYFFA
jgi:hypothetical protein